MEIRNARGNEITAIISFLKRCYNDFPYEKNGFHFDDSTIYERVKHHIMSPDAFVLVAIEGTNIVGIGAMMLSPSFFNMKQKVATESIWFSCPRLSPFKRIKIMQKILDNMLIIAKKGGATSVFFPVPPIDKTKSVIRFLEKKGFYPLELTLSRGI
jgi:hypothetical protein